MKRLSRLGAFYNTCFSNKLILLSICNYFAYFVQVYFVFYMTLGYQTSFPQGLLGVCLTLFWVINAGSVAIYHKKLSKIDRKWKYAGNSILVACISYTGCLGLLYVLLHYHVHWLIFIAVLFLAQIPYKMQTLELRKYILVDERKKVRKRSGFTYFQYVIDTGYAVGIFVAGFLTARFQIDTVFIFAFFMQALFALLLYRLIHKEKVILSDYINRCETEMAEITAKRSFQWKDLMHSRLVGISMVVVLTYVFISSEDPVSSFVFSKTTNATIWFSFENVLVWLVGVISVHLMSRLKVKKAWIFAVFSMLGAYLCLCLFQKLGIPVFIGAILFTGFGCSPIYALSIPLMEAYSNLSVRTVISLEELLTMIGSCLSTLIYFNILVWYGAVSFMVGSIILVFLIMKGITKLKKTRESQSLLS